MTCQVPHCTVVFLQTLSPRPLPSIDSSPSLTHRGFAQAHGPLDVLDTSGYLVLHGLDGSLGFFSSLVRVVSHLQSNVYAAVVMRVVLAVA